MDAPSILFALALLLIPVGVAIPFVGSAVTPGEVRAARLCFCLSAALLVVGWGLLMLGDDKPPAVRVLFGAVVGMAVFVGLPEGLRWINHRQTLTPASLGKSSPTSEAAFPSPVPAPPAVTPGPSAQPAQQIAGHALPAGPIARLVIDQLQYLEVPGDPEHRRIQVTLSNSGPGPAYAGYSGFAILPAPHGKLDDSAIDANLNELIARARAAPLGKDLVIEVGGQAAFVVNGRFPSSLWKDVVDGKTEMYGIAVYGYLDDTVGPGELRVSHKVIRYLEGDGNGMTMERVKQGTRTMERAGK